MKSINRIKFSKKLRPSIVVLGLLLVVVACDTEPQAEGESELTANANHLIYSGPYEFVGSVYDISTTPDGSVMVAVNNEGNREVKIIKRGEILPMATVPSQTDVQGVHALGNGNAFLTSGGSDLAEDGELYRASFGNVSMVADLGAYEQNNDPDAFEGTQWKDQECEAIDGFSAGPQNNPYKVVAESGGSALIADAAGNTVLRATTSGEVEWFSILTPPVDNNGNYMIRWYAGPEGDIPCYVQPVPTSVALGPDGSVFVGELTGALSPLDGVFPIGLSRVWKISAGANQVVCSEINPSPEAQLLIDGLTSVIDIEIGPDGLLYVVEFDESSWFSAFIPGVASGGTITKYDLDGNLIEVVAAGLEFPSAITFDKWGNLWLLENNSTFNVSGNNPTVRILE